VAEGKKLYLSNGEGMTKVNIQAFNLFFRAAEAGHKVAQYFVYRCYRFGHGVHGDKATFLERLRRANETDYAMVLIRLGVQHHSGKQGYPKDEDEALELYQRAAESDSRTGALACTLIGVMYGDRHDYAEELEWQKRGAELGDWEAFHSVIYAYRRGKTFPPNYVAYSFKGNNAISQSYVEAYKWLLLGEDEGITTKEQAAALAALMSPSQLETAQRLCREFKAKYSPRKFIS
jgi:TPR repeat protein